MTNKGELMSKKDKTLKGIKTPSRRKFFKAAAATSAVAAAAAPVAAAALKNLRLEGVLTLFNVFSFLDIFVSL